jgi:hypothetical protein
MQALLLSGLILYYAAVAAAFDWLLDKHSLWLTSFLSIVVSQTVLFGGHYLYRGNWETSNYIAIFTTGGISIVTTTMVAFVFARYRLHKQIESS